jgi:hypothetical protein
MAFGDRSVSGIATGVSDLFAAQGELSRVRGQGRHRRARSDH